MLDPRKMLLALLLGASILTEISCSTSRVKSSDAVLHRLHRIILRNLHARRPEGPGADPSVSPGGRDYTSHPKPDSRLDCKPLRDFYASEKLGAIRQCLKSVPAGTALSYRVRYKAEPILELEPTVEDVPAVPSCVHELISRVVVPREVFFQSAEEGKLECYSSRLPIESEKLALLDVQWPLSRTYVGVVFPLPVEPMNDEETIVLLETWALAPYFDPQTQRIASLLVTEDLCRTCIGEENLYHEPDRPAPPHWPE